MSKDQIAKGTLPFTVQRVSKKRVIVNYFERLFFIVPDIFLSMEYRI